MSDKPALFTIDTSGLDNIRREVMLNRHPVVRHLIKAAGYLGIGALVHAWLIGPQFDQGSLWSWGYLFAWPVPLFFWIATSLLIFLVYALALIVGCAALWWIAVDILDRRERRARARRFGRPGPRD